MFDKQMQGMVLLAGLSPDRLRCIAQCLKDKQNELLAILDSGWAWRLSEVETMHYVDDLVEIEDTLEAVERILDNEENNGDEYVTKTHSS